MQEKQRTIVKVYKGTESQVTTAFQNDVGKMESLGYYPTSQNWVAGSYGCLAFGFAFLLCFILIGIIVFIYMLIVKPDGTLSVTYELRELSSAQVVLPQANEKKCPMCAESIKQEAVVCRYCGHNFN